MKSLVYFFINLFYVYLPIMNILPKNIIILKGKIKFNITDKTKKHIRQSSWKTTAMIVMNDDTDKYYRWFVQRKYPFIMGKKANINWLNPPLRGSHVTIINDRKSDMNLDKWDDIVDKYENTEASFFIDVENGLRNNGEHIYYKVECPIADTIRKELGLGKPFYDFHLTIGSVNPETSRFLHIKRIQKYMINES